MKRKSDVHRSHARKLCAAGTSTREAAAMLAKKFPRAGGFSEAWVRQLIKATPQPDAEDEDADDLPPPPRRKRAAVQRSGGPTPPAAESAAECAAAPTSPPPDVDVLAHTREQLQLSIARAQAAADDGNHTASQRFSKQIVDYTLLLARLDKERRTDTESVVVSRVELERAKFAHRERGAALVADLQRTGGLVCSRCGCEIRIMLAKGEA